MLGLRPSNVAEGLKPLVINVDPTTSSMDMLRCMKRQLAFEKPEPRARLWPDVYRFMSGKDAIKHGVGGLFVLSDCLVGARAVSSAYLAAPRWHRAENFNALTPPCCILAKPQKLCGRTLIKRAFDEQGAEGGGLCATCCDMIFRRRELFDWEESSTASCSRMPRF